MVEFFFSIGVLVVLGLFIFLFVEYGDIGTVPFQC